MKLEIIEEYSKIILASILIGAIHSVFCFAFPPSALAAPIILFMTVFDEETQPKIFGIFYLISFIATNLQMYNIMHSM